jgi:hypothetical protein
MKISVKRPISTVKVSRSGSADKGRPAGTGSSQENNGGNMNDNSRIRKLLLIIILAVVIAIIALAALSGFITDYLWFNDLSYSDVFWKQLLTEL